MDSGSSGELSLEVDLGDVPIGDGRSARAGETLHFQALYRDFDPYPTTNLTDALAVLVR